MNIKKVHKHEIDWGNLVTGSTCWDSITSVIERRDSGIMFVFIVYIVFNCDR